MASQRLPALVNREASHHLPAETHGGDFTRVYTIQKFSGGQANGVPPVVRILFRPITVGVLSFIPNSFALYQDALRY